jgi:hypothetical protein
MGQPYPELPNSASASNDSGMHVSQRASKSIFIPGWRLLTATKDSEASPDKIKNPVLSQRATRTGHVSWSSGFTSDYGAGQGQMPNTSSSV